MSWEMTAAGTVHLDDIVTPHGRQDPPDRWLEPLLRARGGAARRVHVSTIVGEDATAELRRTLAGLPVELGGVEVSPEPTFRWHAVHDFERWVAVTVAEEPGCDPEWRPRLTPEAARAPVLFLGSMRPSLQRDILAQSSARLSRWTAWPASPGRSAPRSWRW